MPPMPSGVRSGTAANKSNPVRNPRKALARPSLARLGQIERLVLRYAAAVADLFSPSDVVVYYNLKEEHGSNANKRVHDAVQRLLRRGILEKVGRGLYRLVADVPPSELERAAEAKESLWGPRASRTPTASTASIASTAPATSSASRATPRRYLVRLHVRPSGGGLAGAYARLYAVREVTSHALRALEVRLVEVYGRSFLRRLRAWLRRSVEIRASALGVHGRYGRRSPGLLPLRYLDLGFAYEVGLDAVVDLPFDRLFAKVYLRDLARDRSLLEYARSLSAPAAR